MVEAEDYLLFYPQSAPSNFRGFVLIRHFETTIQT